MNKHMTKYDYDMHYVLPTTHCFQFALFFWQVMRSLCRSLVMKHLNLAFEVGFITNDPHHHLYKKSAWNYAWWEAMISVCVQSNARICWYLIMWTKNSCIYKVYCLLWMKLRAHPYLQYAPTTTPTIKHFSK